MDALSDPAVAAAVARAYAVLGRYRVSSGLEVCTCPVCMTDAMRAALIATPVPDLPRDLLAEYTASAHGVPRITDDLKALLPRYLDLISAGQEPDILGTGCVLRRFGEAVRADPDLWLPEERVVLQDWAAAMVAALIAAGEGGTLWHLIERLAVGGWEMEAVCKAAAQGLAGPQGAGALAGLVPALEGHIRPDWGGVAIESYPLACAGAAVQDQIAGWLSGPGFAAALQAAVLGVPDNGLDWEMAERILALWSRIEAGPVRVVAK